MIKSAMIKVVTFDLDDTLWHATPVLEQAERRLFAWLEQHCPSLTARHSVQSLRDLRMELMKSRPDLAHQITEARRTVLHAAMQETGMSAEAASWHASAAMEVFLEARHEIELFDEVEEVIAALHGRYMLGALTNGNANIYRLSLGCYFSFAYSAEALNSSKPLPGHFEETLRKTAATAGEIVHVGDHAEHDIIGAQRCGWHTIWVNPQELDWEGVKPPSATVSRISDIPAAIARIDASLEEP
jgi:HAD superfamily hydrolase (TIGR01549 family)